MTEIYSYVKATENVAGDPFYTRYVIALLFIDNF